MATAGIQDAVARVKREGVDGDGDSVSSRHLFAPIAPGSDDWDERTLADFADKHSVADRHDPGFHDLLRQQRVVAGFDDERVEPYRQLRTRVVKAMHENRWNALAITSAHEGAGKTLTAVNLALSIARDVNHTVMLVDLDLRTPTVHEKLGLDVEYGIVDYLRGAIPIEKVAIYPRYPRLAVLPGRPLSRFSSELLSSPRMKRLMASLVAHYDSSQIVIFDLPPLLRNDDALLFAPLVHALLFVVEDGVTTAEQFDHSMSLLGDTNVLGTVLNKSTDDLRFRRP